MRKLILLLTIFVMCGKWSAAQSETYTLKQGVWWRNPTHLDSLFVRALKTDTDKIDSQFLANDAKWQGLKPAFVLGSTGIYPNTLSLSAGWASKSYPVYYWYNHNALVFTTSTPDQTTGKTTIHIHRSQLRWLNDTTAVIMPHRKPKRKVKHIHLNYFPNHSRIVSDIIIGTGRNLWKFSNGKIVNVGRLDD